MKNGSEKQSVIGCQWIPPQLVVSIETHTNVWKNAKVERNIARNGLIKYFRQERLFWYGRNWKRKRYDYMVTKFTPAGMSAGTYLRMLLCTHISVFQTPDRCKYILSASIRLWNRKWISFSARADLTHFFKHFIRMQRPQWGYGWHREYEL